MTVEHQQRTLKQKIAQGMTAFEGEQYDEALEVFKEVLFEHPKFPDIHNKAGLCKAMLGDSEGALVSFQQAVDLSPGYAEAHLNRGIILNELGRHEEAQEALSEAARLDHRDGTIPSDVGNQIANLHADLGDLYLRAGRPEKAAEEYRKALEVRPRYLDIHNKLADTLAEIGEPQAARKELELVLEKNPNIASARIRMGTVLHQLGDVEGAIREWKLALELDPEDSRPKAYLASVGAKLD